jgi:pimeloyl-ACP methyl ester carboxylesterase
LPKARGFARIIPVDAEPQGKLVRNAVHLRGNGPMLVLPRGDPLDHRMWRAVPRRMLAQRPTQFAIDLRGPGPSSWRGTAVPTIKLFAQDIAVARSIPPSND